MTDNFTFPDEFASIFKDNIPYLIPQISNEPKESFIADYYSYKSEPNLVNMYHKNICAYPNTPNHFQGPGLLSKLQLHTNDNKIITVSSYLEEKNIITEESKTSEYQWRYSDSDFNYCIYHEPDDNNRTKIFYNDIYKYNTVYRICSVFSFDYDEKPGDNLYKFSIHIYTLFGPEYDFDYLHDNHRIKFYYDQASSTRHNASDTLCMCNIIKLGMNDCPFQQYLNKYSIKKTISELMELSYDIKEKLTDSEYLNLTNLIHKLNKQVELD